MAPISPLSRLVILCRRVAVLVALFLLVGILSVGFSRVFLRFTVRFVWFIVSDVIDVRGVRNCGTSWEVGREEEGFLFVCVIILFIRWCVTWSSFFISSVTVHVLEVKRRDGVCCVEEFESVTQWVCW